MSEEFNSKRSNVHDGSTLDSFLLEEAQKKIKQWEECADMLFVYAMETLQTAPNMALYEAVKEDILKYNKLKNETQSQE